MRNVIKSVLCSCGLLPAARKSAAVVRQVLGTRDLWFPYIAKSDLSPWLRDFRLQASRSKDNSPESLERWCKYLIALLELHREDELHRMFTLFTSDPERRKYISHFFRLSEYGVSIGMTDSEIMSTAELWTILKSNHNARKLESLVTGKTVAIVGNGPSEIGKGLGPEIDAHDFVVRMNNFQVTGYEADYGTKTDVWTKNNTPQIIDERPDLTSSRPFILYTSSWERESLSDKNKSAYLNDAKSHVVDYVAMSDTSDLRSRLNVHLTAGIILIELFRNCRIQYLDAYGFSFLENTPCGYRHYGTDIEQKQLEMEIGAHNIDVEREYCKVLFGGGRRLYPVK